MMINRFIPRIFFPLAVAGTLGLFGVVYHFESKELRHRFLHQSRLMATSIPSGLVGDLTGQPGDMDSESYRRIKDHLQRLTPHYPELRFTYFLGLRPDGEVVFLADNEPGGGADEATPGMVYEEIQPRMREAMENRASLVTTAYRDRWGRWVSAVIPLQPSRHPQSEPGLSYYFVADIPASVWNSFLWRRLTWPGAAAAGLILIFLGRGLVKRKFRHRPARQDHIDLIAFILAGLLLSVLVGWIVHRLEAHRSHNLFSNIAEMKLLQIREAIHDLDQGFLHPVAREIAIQRSPEDRHERFEKAVAGHHLSPLLDAVAWAVPVPAGEKSAFLKTMRALDPEFEIWELDESSGRQEAGERDVYFPIIRVMPREGPNPHPARGFDEASESHRHAALERALQSDTLTFSAPVSLVYLTGQPGNLTCFYPVRDPVTQQFIGFLVGGVRSHYLMNLSRILPDLHSMGDVSTGQIFFAERDRLIPLGAGASGPPPESKSESVRMIAKSPGMAVPLHLGGQTFIIQLVPGPLFRTYHHPWIGGAMALGGVATTLITAFGLGLLFRRRAELEVEVAQRTSELEKSEARLRQIFEESSEAYVWLMDGRIKHVNRAFCDLMGYEDPALLEGKAPWEFSPEFQPDGTRSQSRAEDFLNQALREGTCRLEWQLQRPDGSLFWVETLLTRVDSEEGPLIFASKRDITDRKQSMEDNQRLRTAVEQADEVVVITDAAGTIQYVNPAFEKITGYSAGEAIGANPRILKSGHHPESFYKEMWKTLTSGRKWEGRMVNRTKDGALYTEQATISPVRDKHGNIVNYIAVKRNITRELELEKQFLQSQKMETVGQLAGGIAHDFNNVLQAILGYASLAAGEVKGQRAEEYISELIKAAHQAAGITRQLLSFSRKNPIELKPVRLNEIIEGILKMIDRLLEDHIDIRINLASSLPQILADSGQIEQVLLNLCINSRDAMPDGGTIRLRSGKVEDPAAIRERHKIDAEELVFFSVEDTGCGIPSSEIPKIFEPFYTSKDQGQGTGLGLPSVYGIVQQHGGAIEVSSRVGKGTTMTIYLPALTEINSPDPDPASPAIEPASSTGHGETILLADDYDMILNLTRRILEQAGYRVLAASNGREAMEIIAQQGGKIDLVISDLVMPEGGGREIQKKARKSFPDLPFLFMSGYDPDSNDARNQRGHLDLIRKPFQPDELLQAIQRHLKQSG